MMRRRRALMRAAMARGNAWVHPADLIAIGVGKAEETAVS